MLLKSLKNYKQKLKIKYSVKKKKVLGTITASIIAVQVFSFSVKAPTSNHEKQFEIKYPELHTIEYPELDITRGGYLPDMEDFEIDNRISESVNILRTDEIARKLAKNMIYKSSLKRANFNSESYNKKAEFIFGICYGEAKDRLNDPDFRTYLLTEAAKILIKLYFANKKLPESTTSLPIPIQNQPIVDRVVPKKAGWLFADGFKIDDLANIRGRHSRLNLAQNGADLFNLYNSSNVNKRRTGIPYTKPGDSRVLWSNQLLDKYSHRFDFIEDASPGEIEIFKAKNATKTQQTYTMSEVLFKFLYKNTTKLKKGVKFHDEEIVNVYYNDETQQAVIFEGRTFEDILETYISGYKIKNTKAFLNFKENNILGISAKQLKDEATQTLARKAEEQALAAINKKRNEWVRDALQQADALVSNQDIRNVEEKTANLNTILRVAKNKELTANFTKQFDEMFNKTKGED